MKKRVEWVSSRTLLEKLGVRGDSRVLLVGLDAHPFVAQLREVTSDLHETETGTDFDFIFFRVTTTVELARLRELRQLLKANGTLWLIRPKGKGTPVPEAAAFAAGKDAGLVDVKVVNFSAEESALKYVIPLAQRA